MKGPGHPVDNAVVENADRTSPRQLWNVLQWSMPHRLGRDPTQTFRLSSDFAVIIRQDGPM